MNKYSWNLSDLKNIKPNGYKVMSTFACGGGSSMGYKLAGYEVIAANDIDPEMAWHYKKNINPKYYFLCPIKDLLKADLPKELFELDILDGSPPCSTFSMAGKREKNWGKNKKFREGQASQVLSDLFFDFIEVVAFLKPKVVVAENVKGIIQGNAKGYVKEIKKRFQDAGYKVQIFLLNAKYCGVAQNRERVFFCCYRDGFDFPKLRLNLSGKILTVGQVCNDIQKLTDEEIKTTKAKPYDLKYWPKTKNGESYEKAAWLLDKKKKLWSSIRLNKNRCSNTLTTNSVNFMHWNQCRSLTFREYKRIGSFPDDYISKDEKLGKYLVGMSVPPKMIEVIAKAVKEQWLDKYPKKCEKC
jgi:DNA (cytosine-5)-methyltransferase 1